MQIRFAYTLTHGLHIDEASRACMQNRNLISHARMPINLKQMAFHMRVCVCVAHMLMLCGVSICRSELHLYVSVWITLGLLYSQDVQPYEE